MIEINNQEPTPTKCAYYRDLPAGGKSYDFVTLLPGLNLIPEKDVKKVGIGTPDFPYSHIERTDVSKLPTSIAINLAERSVATDALRVWLMMEKRPAVRAKLQEKLAQRAAALEEEPIEEPSEVELDDLRS